jgi:hypothetical protein
MTLTQNQLPLHNQPVTAAWGRTRCLFHTKKQHLQTHHVSTTQAGSHFNLLAPDFGI